MYTNYLLILIIAIGYYISTINGFNLDTVTHRRYRGDKGTMFGFSVALHRNGQQRVILVGAPEAQTDQPGVEKGGAVYFCETNGEFCAQLIFDSSGSNTQEGEQIDSKSFQWFGATVRSSGSVILACAPRYISYTNMKNRRDPVGTCWVAKNGSSFGSLEYSEYSPCRTKNWGYHRQGSCQAGLGASVSKDGKRLFVGAVGSWYWQGQLHSIDSDARLLFIPRSYSYYVEGMLVSQNLHARPDVISSQEGAPSDDDSYLGYSVAAGDFSGLKSVHGDVAVGMPRGDGLRGKIVIFTWNMTIIQNVTGEQLGAYFGYSVCACDVNGDGRQDLIVGAPLYTDANNEGKYETGRVYIYIAPENHIFGIPIKRDGINSKARFGLSLTSVGDINKDGYEDFAVGAPYDGPEERGAVYLYHGSRTGVREKESQIIYSEDVPGRPITFGFSLSGGLDMDLNEYPDLAVGAYESDIAIFLRSRPVVKLDSSVLFLGDGKQISLEERNCSLKDRTRVPCIQMRSCLSYSGVGVNNELDFEIQFVLDAKKPRSPRMFFLSEEGRNVLNQTVRLKRGERACKNNFVYLKTNFRDKLTSLDVEMRYSLIGDNIEIRRERRSLFPVLDLNEDLFKRDSISIQKNCGKDNICIPDLRLIASPSVKQYLLGSGERMNIDVLVQNEGEDAFEASFKMHVAPGLNYVNIERLDEAEREIPVQCSPPGFSNNYTLHCDIGNPLPKEKLVHFKVILQPFHQEGMSPRYDFYMSVNSTNPENKSSLNDNKMHVTVPIWVDSDLILTGSSLPIEIHYNDTQYQSENVTQESEIGPQVVHIYSIRNKGPSDILEAEAYFLWPSFTLAGEHLFYLVEQPETTSKIKCEFIPEINVEKIKIDRKRKSYLDGEGHSPGVQSGLTSESNEETSSSSSTSTSTSSRHWSSSSSSSSSSVSGTLGRDRRPLTAEEARRLEELEKKREEEEALKESGDGTNRYRTRTKNQGGSSNKHYSLNGGSLESDSHSRSDYDSKLFERGHGTPSSTSSKTYREHTQQSGGGRHFETGTVGGGRNRDNTYYEERHSSSNTSWKSGEPSVTRTSSFWMKNENGTIRNGSTSNVHLGPPFDSKNNRERVGIEGTRRDYSEDRHFETGSDSAGLVTGGRNRGSTYYEERHSSSNTSWKSGEPSVTRTSSSWMTNENGTIRNGSTSNVHLGGTAYDDSRNNRGRGGSRRNHFEEKEFERNISWSSRDGDKPQVSESSSWRTDNDGIVRNGSSSRVYGGEVGTSRNRAHSEGSQRRNWDTVSSQGRETDEFISTSSRHHTSEEGTRHSGHRHSGNRYNEERHRSGGVGTSGGNTAFTGDRETRYGDSSLISGTNLQGRNRTFAEERHREWNTTWSSSDQKPKTTELTTWRKQEDGVVTAGSHRDDYEGGPRLDSKSTDLINKPHLHIIRTDSSGHNIDENVRRSGTGEKLYTEERQTSYNTSWSSATGNKPITRTSTSWRTNEDGTVRSGSSSDVYEGTAPPLRGVGVDGIGGSRSYESNYDSRRTSTHTSSSEKESERRESSRRGYSGDYDQERDRTSSNTGRGSQGSGREHTLQWEYERRGGSMGETRNIDQRREQSTSNNASDRERTSSGSNRDHVVSGSGYDRREYTSSSDRREHGSSGTGRNTGYEYNEDSSTGARTEYSSGSRHSSSARNNQHTGGGHLSSSSGSSGGFDFGAVAQGPRDGVARTYTLDLGISDKGSDSGSSSSSSSNRNIGTRQHEHHGGRSGETTSWRHHSSAEPSSQRHGTSSVQYSSEQGGYSTRRNEGDYDLGPRHGSSLSSRQYSSSSSRHYSSSSGGGHSSSSGGTYGSDNDEGTGGMRYHESHSWSSNSGTANGDEAQHGGAYTGRSLSNDETRGKFVLYPRYKRDAFEGKEDLKESLKCGPTKCTKIKCMIGALKNDEEAMVAFRSRVWVRTIQKLSSSMEIHVSSMVAAQVTKLPHIGTPDVVTTYTHEVHSQIMPTEAGGKPDYVPLWVVVLSACAGAIILMLLVYLLYKCGFFKRNRPSNAPEKQPLNRNGHYNGDEAL